MQADSTTHVLTLFDREASGRGQTQCPEAARSDREICFSIASRVVFLRFSRSSETEHQTRRKEKKKKSRDRSEKISITLSVNCFYCCCHKHLKSSYNMLLPPTGWTMLFLSRQCEAKQKVLGVSFSNWHLLYVLHCSASDSLIIFDAKRKEALIQNKMPNLFGLAFKHDVVERDKMHKEKPHVTFLLLGTPDECKFMDFGSLPSGKELIKNVGKGRPFKK